MTSAGGVAASTDLTWTSAGNLARMIAAGEVSSKEVVGAHVARIQEVNGKLNAVVLPRFEQALAEADAADAARARGEQLGPLHGVAITVKECWDMEGMDSTGGGLRRLAGHKVSADAPMVARLRKAGAVVLGKTNMPHMMLYNEGDNPLYGRTNNPWDLQRTPGGGSSGEGAIIAAGGSPLGLATDYGGSVRIPPDFCGIQGFRPTYGRLTMAGAFDSRLFPGLETPIDQPGMLARATADIVLGFDILRQGGEGEGEHALAPRPWRDPGAVSIRGLRVAYYEQDEVFRAAPAKRRAVREAARMLADMGAEVEEFLPPDIEAARNLFIALLGAGGNRWIWRLAQGEKLDRRAGDQARMMRLRPHTVRLLSGLMRVLGQATTASFISRAGARTAGEYWDLVVERDRYRDRFLAALDRGRYDVILCPAFPLPAYRHGANYYLGPVFSYTQIYNLLGLPQGQAAITRVRAGEESDRPPSRDIVTRVARKTEEGSAGLPAGVQVLARYWREDLVLAVMGALEERFRSEPSYPARPPI